MRKLLFSLLTLAALCGGVCAQYVTLPGFPPGVFQDRGALDGATATSPAYTFVGSASLADNSTTEVYCNPTQATYCVASFAMGSTANYTALVAVYLQSGTSGQIISVTICGQSLSATSSPGIGTDLVTFWSAPVTGCSGSQNITVVTASGTNFNQRDIAVWTLTGLNSTSPKATADGAAVTDLAINVSAGDLLFSAVIHGGGVSYTGSTQAPFEDSTVTGQYVNITNVADWTAMATSSPFTIHYGFTVSEATAVTFR